LSAAKASVSVAMLYLRNIESVVWPETFIAVVWPTPDPAPHPGSDSPVDEIAHVGHVSLLEESPTSATVKRPVLAFSTFLIVLGGIGSFGAACLAAWRRAARRPSSSRLIVAGALPSSRRSSR
jgi:hypothetical protein